MTHTLKLAINRHIINKIESQSDPRWEIFTAQCENVELTIAEFSDHINQGHAFCAQHKNRKKNANFIGTNIVTVDIDKDMTVEQALADPFVRQYGTLLYTTPSHTPDQHRFRLIFMSDRIITDSEEMKLAYKGIIRKFGGDDSCSDACRGFFGSTGSNPIILGNVLPNDELTKLIVLGGEKRVSATVCSDTGNELGGKSTQTSSDPLEKNQMVKLARGLGRMVLLADLPKWTSIHCPKHFDNKPSAFVVTNKDGINGVRCHKCCASFWPQSELWKKRKPYNFYEIEDFVREQDYVQTPANFYDMDAEDAHPSLLDDAPGERNNHILNEKYLPNIPLHEGVTFVRSPKGSGKTEWLQKIVNHCREKHLSVLLVGHRQLLIQGLAKRLGLICYFYTQGGQLKNNQSDEYYSVCVDSIGKLLRPGLDQYDVIIMDESEQVFSHLTADTLRSKRRICYQKLFYFLRSAKSVIFTDADLGPVTIVAACESVKANMPYQFYLNEYKESRCDFHYYESEDHLVQEMIDTIRGGGRHYVCTNSKNKAENLLEAIRYEFGAKRKTMLVTSDTAGNADVKHFVNNIKTEILNYDVVVASPTLGTGIDITFMEQAQHIDTVYGFFVSRVNTHFDIDQQLSRVRHPKLIKAWVTPERFNFETEADVIRNEVLDNAALNDALMCFEDDGRPKLDDSYLNVYASVTAMQRASKNNLRTNLLNLRVRNGWTVQNVAMLPELAKDGKRRTKDAKDVLTEKRAAHICDAGKITPETYQELYAISKQGIKLTRDEEHAMRRHEIEAFYREEISKELISLDDNGKYRDQVRMMQIYLAPLQYLLDRSSAERKAGRFVTDMTTGPLKKVMLYDLLEAAGLADTTTLVKTGVIVSEKSLATFTAMCRARASKIQELFGLKVHKNTMQTLGRILDLIGLKNCPATREKVNGKTTYYYELDVGTLNSVRDIVDRRMSISTNSAPEISGGTNGRSAVWDAMRLRERKMRTDMPVLTEPV